MTKKRFGLFLVLAVIFVSLDGAAAKLTAQRTMFSLQGNNISTTAGQNTFYLYSVAGDVLGTWTGYDYTHTNDGWISDWLYAFNDGSTVHVTGSDNQTFNGSHGGMGYAIGTIDSATGNMGAYLGGTITMRWGGFGPGSDFCVCIFYPPNVSFP